MYRPSLPTSPTEQPALSRDALRVLRQVSLCVDNGYAVLQPLMAEADGSCPRWIYPLAHLLSCFAPRRLPPVHLATICSNLRRQQLLPLGVLPRHDPRADIAELVLSIVPCPEQALRYTEDLVREEVDIETMTLMQPADYAQIDIDPIHAHALTTVARQELGRQDFGAPSGTFNLEKVVPELAAYFRAHGDKRVLDDIFDVFGW